MRGRAAKLGPGWAELWALVGLCGFYLVADAFGGESSYAAVNVIGPLGLSIILSCGAFSLVRRDLKQLWTALFWFRLSTIVFFGVGTYLVFVLDQEARTYLEGFFAFFDQDVFKMNLVIAVGVAITLASARVAVLIADRQQTEGGVARKIEDDHNLPLVASAFLAVGLIISYGVKVPYDLGWISLEVPGAIMNLTRLKLVGFFLVTIWALQQARWWLPVIASVVAADLLCHTLLFAKGDFLISLLMFLLAFIWHHASIKRLVLSAVVVIVAFAALQPIVSDGRQELEQRYGDEPQAGLMERAEIIGAYLTDERLPDSTRDGASALTRLTYVNAATLVITQYDSGQPGDWPRLLPAVFIPRLFWPDKPIISDIGRDIYELGTGRRTSQSGAGIFADAYWAMGWWGMVIFMPFYGLILGSLTVVTMRIIQQGRWFYFPVVLMAMRIGSRTDGHYLADVAGGTVILAGTFGVLWLAVTAVRWFSGRHVAPLRAVAQQGQTP